MKNKIFPILKNQLVNLFTGALFVVTVLYFVSGHVVGGILVLLIILVNISVGFYQEYQSNKAMMFLKIPQEEDDTSRDSTSNLIKGTMHLAYIILFFVLISLALVFFINMFIERELSTWLEFILFSMALAISAIPSSLSAAIIFCLTKGAMVLHNHKMVVRQLSAIEHLAGIEVLCIDITKTLDEDTFIVDKNASLSNAVSLIEEMRSLGIQIKFVSEDSVDVVRTVTEQLRLVYDENVAVSGSDLTSNAEEQKMLFMHSGVVFTGLTSDQKYQMIAYLQGKYSVGYMSDLIHDLPTLSIANVSIVSGNAAAEIREVATVVLLEKSLRAILFCVEESRKILINILKYVKITVSSNLGNFYSIAFSSLLINYLPVLPLQLLFLDLVSNFPLVAISTDLVDKEESRKSLHFSVRDIFVTLLFGLVSVPFNFMIFILFKHHPGTLQTNWFISASLGQLVLIFSLRTKVLFLRGELPSVTFMSLCIVSAFIVIALPFTTIGHQIFLFVHPEWKDLLKIISITITYFMTIETVKLFYHRGYNGK